MDENKVEKIKKELVEIKEMFNHLAEPTDAYQRDELKKVLESIEELETYLSNMINNDK